MIVTMAVDTSDAAERFVRRLHAEHGDVLFGWALRRTADRRDAEEIVAETLARAWRAASSYDPARGSERTWIFAIARNVAVDTHRRAKRHLRAVPSAEVPETPVDDDTERLAETSLIRDALLGLPEHQRRVIIDVYFEGYSGVQVADDLGVAPGTVKSRLFYGLRAMRASLEEQGLLR